MPASPAPSPPRHLAVLADVQDLCASLDPATVSSSQIDEVFRAFASMRRLVDGALTRLGPRYERSGTWRERGALSAPDAVARATGETPADSKRRLDAGKKAEHVGVLDDALQTGTVSTEQATVIAGAVDDDEGGQRLIDVARSGSHKCLRDEAAHERARADADDAARRARQHRARCVRRWTDEDGMYNLHLRALPEVGAEIDARLEPLTDAHFATARREGRRESADAYAADAVTDLLTGTDAPSVGGGQSVRPERKVIALVDIDSLNRGRTEGDETCEIAGVGPVSVAAVRALFGDAATAVVFRDAVDIRSVVHFGRQVTATQRTALEARGPRCGIVGCGSTHHLEIDHTIGWTYTRVTEVDDLEWLCSVDHRLKTQRNLLAIGPPGQRVLVERDPVDPTKPRHPLVQVRPEPTPASSPAATSRAAEAPARSRTCTRPAQRPGRPVVIGADDGATIGQLAFETAPARTSAGPPTGNRPGGDRHP